jgi:ubiquinone biosynthesis protein UbiJ
MSSAGKRKREEDEDELDEYGTPLAWLDGRLKRRVLSDREHRVPYSDVQLQQMSAEILGDESSEYVAQLEVGAKRALRYAIKRNLFEETAADQITAALDEIARAPTFSDVQLLQMSAEILGDESSEYAAQLEVGAKLALRCAIKRNLFEETAAEQITAALDEA